MLQEREYRPLGSTHTLKADFRVIAATNRPIAQALAENRLRSDLYYRLNTFQIEAPPLRERKQDIPPLVAFFETIRAATRQTRTGHRAGSFSEIARLCLAGNVRELQNAMEYGVVLARQNLIGVKELPAEVQLPAVLQQTDAQHSASRCAKSG